jgi:hypothetical protein
MRFEAEIRGCLYKYSLISDGEYLRVGDAGQNRVLEEENGVESPERDAECILSPLTVLEQSVRRSGCLPTGKYTVFASTPRVKTGEPDVYSRRQKALVPTDRKISLTAAVESMASEWSDIAYSRSRVFMHDMNAKV